MSVSMFYYPQVFHEHMHYTIAGKSYASVLAGIVWFFWMYCRMYCFVMYSYYRDFHKLFGNCGQYYYRQWWRLQGCWACTGCVWHWHCWHGGHCG